MTEIIRATVGGLRGPGLTAEDRAEIEAAAVRSEDAAADAGAKLTAIQAIQAALTPLLGTIARVVKIPGWMFAIRDSAKRNLFGITDAGSVFAWVASIRSLTISGSLRVGDSATRYAIRYPGTLYAWADAKKRRLLEILAEGTVRAHWLDTSRLTVGNIRAGSAPVYGETTIAFTAPDAAGDYQVYKQNLASGQVTAITTSGNHTGLRLSGSVVTWLKDGGETEYHDLDEGQTGPVLARRKLIAIGHSMLADYLTQRQPPLPQRVATILGWDVQNFAIQGQQSSQQVARMGLVPLTVTLSGNQIPASGPATVTTRTPNDWIASAYGPRSIYGTLAGVYGYLTWDSSAGERFFRAQDGAAVNIPAAATFVPDINNAFDNVALVWALVNDGAGSQAQREASMANLALIVNAQRALGRRFVILTELNRGTDPSGSAGYNNIMALNGMIQAAYPNNVFDARKALVNAYNPALPGDVTAYDQDRPAPSLREDDDFHPNNAGNAVLAPLIADFIISKGWNK